MIATRYDAVEVRSKCACFLNALMYLKCTLELLKAGASMEDENDDGFTSLMISCNMDSEQCTLELLKAGADANYLAL